METLIIETEGKTLEKIKTFLQEINVSFKIKTKKEEKPYNPEFVKMVLEASKSKVRIPYDEEYKKKLFQDL
jgi:histidinol phosphatase-like PHP family hydrolase